MAEVGTPITLDLQLINQYFQAQRVSPNSIPEPPLNGSAAQKRSWLILVDRRGVNFQEQNFATGELFSLDEQINQALDDIAQKIANIEAVENEIRKNPSFIDLRAELDQRRPELFDEIKELVAYLESFLVVDPKPSQLTLDQRDWGSALQVLEILVALEDFLGVAPTGVQADDLEAYELEIKAAGEKLFGVMTKYAIAQVDRQTVLLLGETIFDRVQRSFGILEQAYLKRDLKEGRKEVESFAHYRRDRALEFDVIRNYRQFSGQQLVLREEKIENTRDAFWLGFQKEIIAMIEMSMKSQAELVPELEDATAPHLCSLFSDLLRRSSSGRRVLEKCQDQFKELELVRLIEPETITIDYDDDCFYSDYSRDIDTQNILFERYESLQANRPGLAADIKAKLETAAASWYYDLDESRWKQGQP